MAEIRNKESTVHDHDYNKKKRKETSKETEDKLYKDTILELREIKYELKEINGSLKELTAAIKEYVQNR